MAASCGFNGQVPSARPGSPGSPNPQTLARRRRLVLLCGVAAVLVVAIAVAVPQLTSGKVQRDGTVVALDPSAFSPGACVAFAPTKGNRHETVFLDAGHGGIDPGAIGTTSSGTTIYEADETLPVELDAAAILRAAGFRVVVSRTKNSSVVKLSPVEVSGSELSLQGAHDDVAARDVCANLAQADVLVGIYFDSGYSSVNAGSLTAYDTDRPFSAANLRLATLLQNDVLAAMNAQGWGVPNAGVLPDSDVGSSVPTSSDSPLAIGAANYGHLLLLGPAAPPYATTPSLMPGAVIEPLFITDPFEASLAASGEGQQVIAAGIAQAVEQFLAPPAKRHPTSTTAAA